LEPSDSLSTLSSEVLAPTEQQVRLELLDASDQTIVEAIEFADLMALRGLLYYLTGDEEVAHTKAELVRQKFFKVPGIVNDEAVSLLRRKAFEFLVRYRDEGAGDISGLNDRLPMSLRLATGLDLTEADVAFYLEELALPEHARRLHWQEPPPPERLESFKVIVIGAGMGGLTAALELKRAGIPYVVFEKNAGVGGTWYENRYPGARVDTPSRGYTNTYGVHFEYPYPFCPWSENQKYFEWVADSFGLREAIEFNTEVSSLTWDEGTAEWVVGVAGPDGERTERANGVITAVGFLSRPSIPDIPGASNFHGRSWHTARWPDDFDAKSKRCAVIGTGCSGYQLIPELALEAEHVTIFQRTAQWLAGTPGYLSPFPPEVNWLDRNLPYYSNFLRSRTAVVTHSYTLLTEIDPDYDDPYACNPLNKEMRDAAIAFLESKLNDPELVSAMTPPHPVWSARPVNCDPEYNVLDALMCDNTTLVTAGIREINATGIEATDGTQHDVDVIVYATGFHATDYLFPMTITGRNGKSLHDVWSDGGARAYLGSMVPEFPNLWMVYGPNTNGSFGAATFHELVTRYALECIERLILSGKREIAVREEFYRSYNELIDERNARRVWSNPRASNYYWSRHGRSVTQNPLSPTEMYQLLRHPHFEELQIH
jgi:4-hydroxyacetophenone monooxygenase